jgi:hypothetical protein
MASTVNGHVVDGEHTSGQIVVGLRLLGHARRRLGTAIVGAAVALRRADIGADPHRAQHRDADLVGPQLAGQHFRQRDDAVLGHAVRAEAHVRYETGERRREQHVAALTLLDHAGHEGFDAVNRPPQVDVDRPPPVVMGHLDDRPAHRHAGVVEDDVHGAEASEGLVGHRLHLLQRTDITLDARRVEAVVLHRRHRGVERALLDVGEDHPRALRPEATRCRQADAAGAACDDGALSFKRVHVVLLVPVTTAGLSGRHD